MGRRLALLVLAALLLRIAPIDHGMPRTYVPDSHMVRNALGMLRDKNPVPRVNQYSSYPYLVPYFLAPTYAVEFVLGKVSGTWGSAKEFADRAAQDPRVTTLPARAWMALFGALTAGAVVLAARAAGLRRGAWVAGALSATCLLNVQFSTHERPWAALVFFGALALWGAVRYERSGAVRDLVLAGVAAGLSFASHQAGAVFLALCGLAWAFAPQGWRATSLRVRLLHGVLCVAAFAGTGLLLGHPYYLVHGRVAQEAVVGGAAAAGRLSIGGQALAFGFSWRSLQRLSWTLLGYDPVLVALGVAGIAAALSRRGTRAAACFMLLTSAYFLPSTSDHVRYLLPVCLVLCLTGGLFAERLGASHAGRAVLAVALALASVQVLRFDWVLSRTDTRAEAEARLRDLPAGSKVAVDHYGPTPELSVEALREVVDLRGDVRTRERLRLEAIEQGRPVDPGLRALPVEECFEFDSRTRQYVVRERARRFGATPAQVLDRLGVTHLLLVERRPRGERPLADLVAGRDPLWTISPGTSSELPEEAFLPTEMDFPLTGLWSVNRPGPAMKLVTWERGP